jgi:hypothetical protein
MMKKRLFYRKRVKTYPSKANDEQINQLNIDGVVDDLREGFVLMTCKGEAVYAIPESRSVQRMQWQFVSSQKCHSRTGDGMEEGLGKDER